MNTDAAGGSPPATPPAQFGIPSSSPPPNAEVPSLGAPPPLSTTQSPTPSSPVDSGASGAAASGPVPPPVAAAVLLDTHITPILDEFEAQLKEQFGAIILAGKSHVDMLVADFEAALNAGHSELAAITDELRKGGIVGRLGSLEMAVASHAAPALAGAGSLIHDGHDLLQTWFNGIKSTFERVVAGVVEDKKQAAAAAAGQVAAPPPPAPVEAPTSPASAQMAAMGIPQFQPPPRL